MTTRSKESKLVSDEEVSLKIIIAKRNYIYERLQKIYETSKGAFNSLDEQNLFLSAASNIEQLRSEFQEVLDNYNIKNLKLNPNADIDYDAWNSFEDLYSRIKCQVTKLSASPSTVTLENRFPTKLKTSLPPIELMSFNGDIRQWSMFYQQFKTLIHDNLQLTDAERVYYLVNKLSDKALSVCAGLAPTAENYSIIWNALISRYNDERTLASTYINQLLDLTQVNANTTSGYHKFMDKFDASINALKQLNIENLADFLFLNIALRKLDHDTVKSFEMSCRTISIPKYASLVQFLYEQNRAICHTFNNSHTLSTNNNNRNKPLLNKISKTFINIDPSHLCIFCKSNDHEHLYVCPRFLKLNTQQRYDFVKQNNCCINCLSDKHSTSFCKSKRKCMYCARRHHSLIHFDPHRNDFKTAFRNSNTYKHSEVVQSPNSNACSSHSIKDRAVNDSKVNSSVAHNSNTAENVKPLTSLCNISRDYSTLPRYTTLLGTAKIKVIDKYNNEHFIRCLVDPGSQSDYITKDCCKRLFLSVSNKNRFTEAHGIGGVSQKILGVTSLQFTSRFNDNKDYHIEPLVVPTITGQLPDSLVDVSKIRYLDKLRLADDQFYQPGVIDVLLGVNTYLKLLSPENLIQSQSPSAIETSLGYIIMGDAEVAISHSSPRSFVSCSYDTNLNQHYLTDIMEKFWKIEELPQKIYLSRDEQECEDIYTSTTRRQNDGRYVVALPFKKRPNILGDSLMNAKKRLLLLEKRFNKYPDLRDQYNVVIQEYIDKGILSAVSDNNCVQPCFYLPHHPVVRNDKSTTKLRIVLDASAKSDNDISLNDILHTGQNLQTDIFNILLNVRVYRIAFFADVRQMYLCIEVQKSHRAFQRILYRFSTEETIRTYEFNRVTFGLRSSPFLALRTLHQLAADERESYPLAASVVERDIYMDDLASSAPCVNNAVNIATQLIQMFRRGGFDLVKWTSNCKELLQHIPALHRQQDSVSFDDNDVFKILGLRWYPATDKFSFLVSPPPITCTKRAILSATARLYDVLGLVGPVILYAKLLIKTLWVLKLNWDETPPASIVNTWQQYISELPLISHLKFPRHIGVNEKSHVSLLAFADASEKAYGCVIYSHVVNGNNPPIITLICSKSRVSPLKIITLARLELCALVLLAKLVRTVYDSLSLRHPIDNIYAFSDSEVALCWACSSPYKFNTFVANRISQIQSYLLPDNFYHIAGSENPADHISRGLLPSQILNCDLWLHGPPWVSLPCKEWPVQRFAPTHISLPEEKTVSFAVSETEEHPFISLSLKFSNWNKYLRSVVYVLRFLKKLPRIDKIITASDIEISEITVIKIVQSIAFAEDIKNIKKGQLCSSTLRRLSPFITDGVLRVGGRLDYSSLSDSQKHPILLPKKGHIVDLIIDYYHYKNFHAGPQYLLAALREKYWILSARRVVRYRIHRCNICFRHKPKPTYPMMSALPACRLEQCNAFTHTGVDFSGPLYITLTRKRGIRSQKAYLCLFVCLVTKAVHLELASDLSSASFLDAFKRFISRRGPCQFIYSDNGTNFVASRSYLHELHRFLKSEEYYKAFNQVLTNNRIVWKLNPPSAPHFGGLWESNIKVVKNHLFRVIGKQILTYEEMLTTLCQIECILNSRPLYVLSSDPSEPTALTPAHFLNLKPLECLPAADLSKERINLLSRFSLIDSLVQSFWKRFRFEYLHTLQSRVKWNKNATAISVGTIVLIDVDNTPPLQWPLGVVTELYPGRDGVVRVAQVKLKNSTLKRPLIKLCPLPTQ